MYQWGSVAVNTACVSSTTKKTDSGDQTALVQTCGWYFVGTSPALGKHFAFGCLKYF